MKMKWMRSLQAKLTGLTDAIVRFPLTTLFLVGAAAVNASTINAGTQQSLLLVTFVVGAFLSAVFQVASERFSPRASTRFLFMILVILLTIGYYLIIRPASTLSMETEIRTSVALFALLIAFIWIPVIKSEISFNKSIMIAFKSFFHTLFFSGVIFGGLAVILSAFNQLIFTIHSGAYSHTANIVFILFAPMYFLSLIPTYPRKNEKNLTQKDTIEKAASCPKFLEILLSYILIPLLSIFTLILIIYMIKNIGGEFWKDNLLEPMLVSYAITVILMYILVSEIENKFTALFRLIFPKVLVPIVLFQITSSILSVVDTGITHTGYYVVLFGIFAAAAGILVSFLPVRKNGVIAGMLIIFSAISIVPPVDAFTISRSSQIDTLKTVLLKNKMLENNTIRPDESIPAKDKQIITDTISYLQMMGYTNKVEWLPDDFNAYRDFQDTFGFKEFQSPGQFNPSVYLNLAQETPITITGYDTFATIEINMAEKNREGKIFDIKKQGKTYSLLKDMQQDQWVLTLEGANNQALITFHTQKIFDKFYDYQPTAGQLSAEEATFTEENDRAKITIVVQNVGIEKQYKRNTNATLLVFVQVK